MSSSLNSDILSSVFQQLHRSNTEFARQFPGESPARQPVHTVYGGAHLFKSDSAQKLGQVALNTLKEYAPTAGSFGKALKSSAPAGLQKLVYNRVIEKLQREPVEDFRIDFEDGYGNRSDEEEDTHADLAAEEVAAGMAKGTLPPFIGIRIKPFSEELRNRAIRTLDVFISSLLHISGNQLPSNFVVTLPKVVVPEQVAALAQLLAELESANNLPAGALKLEIMVETPQSIINQKGESALPALVAAAEGRCIAAHFGVYDYTASMNITAAYQTMDHPACDFARAMMKVALAGTGIWLSDGATNVMPVGPHRPSKNGRSLSAKQKKENRDVVHHAWRLGFDHIMHSLKQAYYQGWDLHPAQLPIRYAAIYTFFLKGLEMASIRLKTFVQKAAQATLIGDVFDDAATGQGLLNYFLRGINCGAITEQEALATGLSLEELRTRSFLKILALRKEQVVD